MAKKQTTKRKITKSAKSTKNKTLSKSQASARKTPKKVKPRSASKARTSSRSTRRRFGQEADSSYFLKIVVFLVLGSFWVRVEHLPDWSWPIPVGLIIGLVFATHEHFQIDRKIEYVILLLAAFVSFWLPIGLSIMV